jgi:hypothetical protein
MTNTTQSTRCVLTITMLLLSSATTLHAQSNSTAGRISHFSTRESDPASLNQLQRSETGMATLAKIKLTALQQSTPQDSTPAQSGAAALSQTRIDSIHERISMIQKLVEKSKEKNAKQEQAKQQKPLDVVPTFPAIESVPKTEPALDPVEPRPDPKITATPPVSATPVVAQPINPFKLATSLFLTGNIEASRKSYEAGLKDATPEEKLWLKCFIGCCFRLEGNFASAESSFRDVTNERTAAYPVDYAKWCLKYLQQRRNSLEQYQQIEAEIDRILKDLEIK